MPSDTPSPAASGAAPLRGRRVVVTRARDQAGELAARLEALGAEVVEAPAIRIEPLDQAPLRAALARLAEYDWLVVTSRNTVAMVGEALRASVRDARALAGVRVAAVGPATAEALRELGIVPAVVPERYVAEGVLEALRARDDVRGRRVLYPAAAGARDVIPAGLRELGAVVDAVVIYRSVPDDSWREAVAARLGRGEVDAVTFTSGSTVRHFVDAVGVALARRARAVTIGPVTSDAAREAGLEVAAEAHEATVPSLVDAVAEVLR
ncbi:MAG TPA: uroporphyrinogen-III synthase [Gemmatimonadaceae bacterium]|nr:uroporphyrinogen-III synthase [Gemmatimonadaceae bacterium]